MATPSSSKAAAAALALALGLAACSPSPEGGATVLKVASQKGGTRALMEASHALDGASYRVEWSEFPSAQTLIEALNAGAADTGTVGDAPFLFGYASEAKIKAVMAYHAAAGGASTGILVPDGSPIRTPADLKGRRIATGKGSIGHYLLLRVLEQAGLKPTEVTVVYLSPGDAKAALAAGSVDAWATWNPYIALATLHGDDRVLVNGLGLLHAIGFQAATDAAIAAKRPVLEDFLRRLAKAEVWEKDHQAEYAQVLAKDTGLPPDVAQAMVASLRPAPAPIDAAMIAEERDTLTRFHAAGVIDSTPSLEGAFDTGFDYANKP